MSNELFKTIEAQGRLITELRAENEELQKQLNIFRGISSELRRELWEINQ
tara:strand:- start:1006 stop:1155 length:150 start_codon:yes stop_codon:yes gene_type:complete